jgi:hypothetical protein
MSQNDSAMWQDFEAALVGCLTPIALAQDDVVLEASFIDRRRRDVKV